MTFHVRSTRACCGKDHLPAAFGLRNSQRSQQQQQRSVNPDQQIDAEPPGSELSEPNFEHGGRRQQIQPAIGRQEHYIMAVMLILEAHRYQAKQNEKLGYLQRAGSVTYPGPETSLLLVDDRRALLKDVRHLVLEFSPTCDFYHHTMRQLSGQKLFRVK